eukprot:TRINITY_DN11057_c0_g3_i1.p1 TRINITY_DN11057_c0_g3~~TRINITY_DN11057_c0_g3_i1.p1  ORF type:complete len:115 (+),score=13.44 TRINITY_DN11057_c0_g3_i1:86-430(+)
MFSSRMSSFPTLLKQMRELRSVAKDKQSVSSDDLPGAATDSQLPCLLTVSSMRKDPKSSHTFSTACAAGPSGHQGDAVDQRKFSSEPPNPALSALQAFRARQERIASRNAPFEV